MPRLHRACRSSRSVAPHRAGDARVPGAPLGRGAIARPRSTAGSGVGLPTIPHGQREWFGVLMRNARRGEPAKCAKPNGDPGAIRTRDPQLRRSTLEILDSITDTYSYNTFQVRLVPAGDRLSRLEGGERCALPAFPTEWACTTKYQPETVRIPGGGYGT